MVQERYDALRLENQLCFPLYACSREIIKRYRPLLDALGLTYTQYLVMLVVWEEGTVSVRDLGKRLYLDSGTLTPVLKTMEKNGLITRRRSPADERVLLVSITHEGAALQARAAAVPEALADSLPLSRQESRTLYQLLYKVLNSDQAE